MIAAIPRQPHSTPLWRSFIALVATSVTVAGYLVTVNAAPARAATPAVVSLTFDDGWADQEAAAQYLAAKGMKGTFYVNSGPIRDGWDSYQSKAQLLNIHSMGHEIGAHTVNHAQLPSLSATAAKNEICNDKVNLESWLPAGTKVNSLAWPYADIGSPGSATATRLKQNAKDCGYSSARGLGDIEVPWESTGGPAGESLPASAIQDKYFTKAPWSVEGSWWGSDTKLKQLVTRTEQSTGADKWLQLTFHHVCPSTCSDAIDVRYQAFTGIVDWLASERAAGRIAIKTVGEAIGDTSTPPPTPTAPGQPSNVTAVAGNASATVSWTAAAANGSPITQYTVTSTPGNATCVPATITTTTMSCTVPGLTNGTPYTFRVTATNGVGTGTASAASNSVTPTTTATAPGQPSNVTAVAGNASATVSWTAAAANGSPITQYTVTSTPGNATCVPATITTTTMSCTVPGLTNGTPYTFRVTATNGVGTGTASAASNSVTPTTTATAPGQPSNVTAVAGNASATVSWTAAAANGSPITQYTVTSTPGNATCVPATITTTTMSCTVPGLTNGTPYTFRVTATNGVGTGTASAASNSVTPTTTPVPATLITNGDLETIDTATGLPKCFQKGGWGTNTRTFATTTTGAHSGTKAVKITVAGYKNGDAKLLPVLDSSTCVQTVAAGKSLSISQWYTSTATTQLVLYYRKAGTWVYWTSGPTVAIASAWTQARFTTPALPAGADAVSFGLTLSKNGTLTVDDFAMSTL